MRRSTSWIKLYPGSRSRFGLRLLFAVLLLMLWSAPSALCAASFTATLDRENVTVGESATLTLKYEGGQPRSFPAPPALPNLQIAGGGTSQNISIVNGEYSASISQVFALTPTQPGEFIIPALKAEIGGQVLTTQPLKLTAVKAPTSAADTAGDKLAFFKLFVPKKEVFVGEILEAEFQVYVRDGLANGDRILQYFNQFEGCPLKAEGFSIIKTAHAQLRRARAGNSTYGVATLVTSLSPVKTGSLTINTMEMTVVLQIPLPNQRRRDPFDPMGFFQQMQVEERRVTLTAEPVTLTALPLPKENIPANFNGAVGNYSMTLSAGPTNVAAGDPVTVKVQISGRGAFDSLALPEQSAWREFKTYPPTTKVDTTDALGLQGTKTFEQVVVPQNRGDHPPLLLAFHSTGGEPLDMVADYDLDAQGPGSCLQHLGRLRVAFCRDEEHVPARFERVAQVHRFGGGGGFIEQRGIRNVEAGQINHHCLEVQQRFEAALGDFGLVRRVGSVPAGILQHIALNHGRRDAVVVAHADVGAEDLVLRGDFLQGGQHCVLAAGGGELERAAQPDL